MGEAKRKLGNKDWQFCAYCGGPRTSVDHVPPKALFVGRGHKFITVPSCDLHNSQKSGDDEKLRNFVSFRIASINPDDVVNELFQTAIRGIKRNPSRHNEILRKTRWMPKLDEFRIPFETGDLDFGTQKIVRGLYWHHKRKPLPESISIRVALLDNADISDRIDEIRSYPLFGSIGNQFSYRGGILEEDETVSAWFLAFHMRMVALAMTNDSRIGDLKKQRAASEIKGRTTMAMADEQF